MAVKKSNQKKPGCGCGVLIGGAVVVLVILMIIGWLVPKDPNYEAGKGVGQRMGQSVRSLQANYSENPSAATLDQLARVTCSNMRPELSGEARDKWIE
jgi:hypothetical protein